MRRHVAPRSKSIHALATVLLLASAGCGGPSPEPEATGLSRSAVSPRCPSCQNTFACEVQLFSNSSKLTLIDSDFYEGVEQVDLIFYGGNNSLTVSDVVDPAEMVGTIAIEGLDRPGWTPSTAKVVLSGQGSSVEHTCTL